MDHIVFAHPEAHLAVILTEGYSPGEDLVFGALHTKPGC
jgi:hypothetical protein